MSETLNYLFGERAYELEWGFGRCVADLVKLLGERPLTRDEWVRYLGSTLEASDRIRYGQNWSPLVITSLEKSRGQCFDAVIFCGLNEGCFPAPLREMPFHIDKRAGDFDDRVSRIDDESVRRFGLWHGPVLNFTAARGLERQRFWDVISNVRRRICFSCFAWDDLDAHAQKEPSELYDWAWWATYGFQSSAVRDAETKKVERRTNEWSQTVDKRLPRADVSSGLKEMTTTIRKRFSPDNPFGPEQFICSSDHFWKEKFGGKPLSVTLAEKILLDPVSVWFEEVLGVLPREIGGTAIRELPLRRGGLLHDAVYQAMRAGWRVSPDVPLGLGRAEDHAIELRQKAVEAWVDRLKSNVERWFGRLPIWWMLELAELRSTARRAVDFFASEQTSQTDYAVELSLGSRSHPALFGDIPWLAKLDHVGTDGAVWKVTDLKTGGGSQVKSLKSAALLKNGEGFQLVIYGLILAQSLGVDFSRFFLRYHYPRLRGGSENVESPLELLAAAAHPPIAYLRQAWERGWFGQRSDEKRIRPLAHLPIPDEVLCEKWNRTEGLNQWPWELFRKRKEEDEESDES